MVNIFVSVGFRFLGYDFVSSLLLDAYCGQVWWCTKILPYVSVRIIQQQNDRDDQQQQQQQPTFFFKER